jgi:outer membrane protein insertion porin family
MSMTRKRRRFSAIRAAVGIVLAAVTSLSMATAQEIEVRGNSHVDSETVRSFVGASGGSVEDARRNLLATGLFSDVRMEYTASRKKVVASVREQKVINRVAFEGNSRIKSATILPELQTKARMTYDPATVERDRAGILELYQRSGRGLATVTPRIVDLPNGTVDVVFSIVEGGKTGVKEIRFVGNQVFSSSRLRDLMGTTEMNFMSFLKNSDVYDPDKIGADQEIIRRYYLKHGYADFRFTGTDAQFDAGQGGWIVTLTVEEGPQYRVSDVQLDSRIDVDPAPLRRRIATSVGDVYNAEAVERSLNDVTTDLARRGYAFAQVRPVGQRNPSTQTINLGYVVEEGPRVYIERLNIRGNTRTRDYVIRREFDLGEGDAYNKVLLDRAERRLNNLGYFKKVRITNEPGTAPDRVVVNVDVEDQATGAFSISGGYSTQDGIISEISVSESNFLGRGQFVRLAGTVGQRTHGVDFSFTEPYFLGYRMAGGFDLFSKYTDQTRYARYENRVTGGQLRLGLPITEEFGLTLRYSLYESQLKVPNTYKQPYNDCSTPLPGLTGVNGVPGLSALPGGTTFPSTGIPAIDGTSNRISCEGNGEASVAIKQSLGRTITSLAGVTLGYNTLDSLKDPRNGFVAELKPEVAGLGGDSKFARVSFDGRYFREIYEDVVGIAHLQAGQIVGFSKNANGAGGDLRITDQFFLGPSLVRGFATSGIGPRDISTLDGRGNALGGSTYFGGSLEIQFPIWGLPRDLGLKGAIFADAGTLFGYKGPKSFDLNRNGAIEGRDKVTGACVGTLTVEPECVNVHDSRIIRSSIGASVLWTSPLGPIRFDYAWALTKDKGVTDPTTGAKIGRDEIQAFRFSGGSRF